jgi:hypothetical protein
LKIHPYLVDIDPRVKVRKVDRLNHISILSTPESLHKSARPTWIENNSFPGYPVKHISIVIVPCRTLQCSGNINAKTPSITSYPRMLPHKPGSFQIEHHFCQNYQDVSEQLLRYLPRSCIAGRISSDLGRFSTMSLDQPEMHALTYSPFRINDQCRQQYIGENRRYFRVPFNPNCPICASHYSPSFPSC